MRAIHWKNAYGLILAIAAALSTYSCSVSKSAYAAPAEASEPSDEASLFQVPSSQLEHLKIVEVRKAVWSTTVHTTGTVDWDANHTTQAITQVNGPISRLLVDLGTPVRVDQALLYVSSPDVSDAISTYRKARNHLDYAKRTLDRSRDLLDHKVIAMKDLETAEQDYNDAGSDVENSLEALKVFGVTQQELDDAQRQGVAINPQLAVRSPIAGLVVQKLVSPGLVIQAGVTACVTVSDVSTVWIQGHIYDRDLDSIRLDDTVEETNASFKQTFHGTVSYIGALIDPATRTTPVRIVTQNPQGMLKKDMFVDAVIHTKSNRKLLSVPTSSILRNDENLPFLYVEASPGQFAQRLVNLGAQQGDDTEIVSGIKEGDKVVAEGSVFLQFANSTR